MVDQVSKEQEAAWERSLETAGEAQIRLQFGANFFGGEHRVVVSRWLAKKERERIAADQERLERSEASIVEQIALARSANTIATQARNAARAALVVATISTIVGIVAMFLR